MRPLATGLVLSTAAALALTGVAMPASAATVTVASLSELNDALAGCTTSPNPIALADDIVATTAVLTVGCDTTLDIGVYDLSVRSIIITPGQALEISGPDDASTGVLTADATGTNYAGIRTSGATLRVSGGSVQATGGTYGAAIGGDMNGAPGGTLEVSGGIVSAMNTSAYGTAIGGAYGGGNPGGAGGIVTVTGGSVTAYAGNGYATVIGGGNGEPGGGGATISVTGGVLTATSDGIYAVTVGGGGTYQNTTGAGGALSIGPLGTVVLSSETNLYASIFGAGVALGIFDDTVGAPGTLTVDGVLSIPRGNLRIPSGTTAAVTGTGKIIGSDAAPTEGAAISGNGTIANAGVIALAPPSALVTGNNRLVTFNAGATPSLRVFGPTLDAGHRTLPTPPTGTAWNTAADGSGTWFTGTDSTAGSGTTTLFAAGPGSLQVSAIPADLVATAGTAYTFPVTVLDSLGAVGAQPTVTYTSDDCTFTGLAVFDTAGVCSISASLVRGPFTLTTNFDITVAAGPATTLGIVAAATSVAQGGTLTFTVSGEDEFGNPVDTTAVELSSSVSNDVIDGLTVRFPHASPHTITATLGAITTSVTVQVIPTPAAVGGALSVTGVDAGAFAGPLGALALLLIAGGALAIIMRRRSA